jgi:UDP-N-acetylmuramate--alanine ligase
MEYKGELNGAPVYDDYGHHPTEITATLQAMREQHPDRRLVLVYQQHQLDRATRLLPELSRAFAQADLVLIPNIYKVRDEATGSAAVTAAELAAAIRSGSGVEALYTQNFAKTAEYLRANLQNTDVLVVMGAGDIYHLTEQLLGK